MANNLKNVVAISGSALTEDHLRKLKKYSSNLVLAFDNDSAGFKASLRANLLAQRLGFKVFKLIYEGKDLGEYFSLKEKPDLQEENFLDWLLNELLKNYQDKKEILNIFLPQIKNLSPLEIDEYLNVLKEKLILEKKFYKKSFKKLRIFIFLNHLRKKLLLKKKL
jgi:DNA primase